MNPPADFVYLNIRAFWPSNADELYGRVPGGQTPQQDALYVWLLSMWMFQECADDELRAMKRKVLERFPCPMHAELFTAITRAMLHYERYLHGMSQVEQVTTNVLQNTLEPWEFDFASYPFRYSLSHTKGLLVSPTRYKAMLQTMREVIQQSDLTHVSRAQVHAWLYKTLVRSLYNAFDRFGPARQTGYPVGGIFAAMATILQSCGIEKKERSLEQTAAKLRKFLNDRRLLSHQRRHPGRLSK